MKSSFSPLLAEVATFDDNSSIDCWDNSGSEADNTTDPDGFEVYAKNFALFGIAASIFLFFSFSASLSFSFKSSGDSFYSSSWVVLSIAFFSSLSSNY